MTIVFITQQVNKEFIKVAVHSRSAQALRNLFTYILNEKSASALGDKITHQHYTLPYLYVVYTLESYYGVRGRMEKPYPRMLSAGRAVSFSATGVRTRFKSVTILMSKL